MKHLLLISAFILGWNAFLHSEDGSTADTASNVYIENLTHLLSLKLYTLTKSNTLEIIHLENRMIMRPNGNTNIGVGFNYNSIGLAVSIGRPLTQSSIQKYGYTSRFDLQVSVYGKRIGMDGFLQGYKGYYLSNPNDFTDWEASYYPQVGDLDVFSLGGSAFYLFNNKRFSYKAAYTRNEVQKKSAGSFSAGFFFYHDLVRSSNGFLPQEVQDSLWDDFDLKEFDATSIGLLAGYQHTFVIRGNFFISLQLTPGIGYRRLSGKALDGSGGIVNKTAGQVFGRAAMGYEFKQFYIGATASTILRSFKYKNFIVDLGTEQFRVTIGKRFDVNRKNR